MPTICCIINCNSKSNSDYDQRNLFVVPKDEERRRKWFDVISPNLREGRRSRKLLYVCDLHFKDDDILRNTPIFLKDGSIDTIPRLKVQLKPSSIPCIFNAKHGVLPNIDLPAAENKRSDPALRKKWQQAIGRSNRVLSGTDGVCELHFPESDIERYFETVMPDDSTHRIPRRVQLKQGAIPNMLLRKSPEATEEERQPVLNFIKVENTIEDAQSSAEETKEEIRAVLNRLKTESTEEDTHSVREFKEETESEMRLVTNCVKIEKNTQESEDNLVDDNTRDRYNETLNDAGEHENISEDSEYTIETLKEDVRKFPLPERWAYVFVAEEVHFLRWDSQCSTVLFTVIISRDLTVEVSIGRRRIAVDAGDVTSFDTVVQHLKTLEKQRLCAGTTNGRRNESCSMFITKNYSVFPRSIVSPRCLPCSISRKTELNRQHRRSIANVKRKLKNEELMMVKSKNALLQMKVQKLQAAAKGAKKADRIRTRRYRDLAAKPEDERGKWYPQSWVGES